MSTVIALPERVDLAASIDLRKQVLEQTGDVAFDASRVVTLTTPGLQVLLAAAPHLSKEGHGVAVTTPSSGFLACLNDFGVAQSALETPHKP